VGAEWTSVTERPQSAQVAAAAVSGSALFLTRSLALQLVGLGATIGIARLVTPSEFGAFAIALAVLQAGLFVTNLGFPAAMIRKEEHPTLAEQRAMVGLTLAIGTALAVIAAAIAFVLLPALNSESEIAELIAIAAVALPLFAARLNSMVIMNRELRFDRVVIVQAVTQLAFYGFALGGAVLGAGPFGLAAAVPLSAFISLGLASALQPWQWGITLELRAIRTLAGFGLQVSVYRLAAALYELGVVTIFAAVGSQALAGFYGLSRRVLTPAYTVVQTLQGVGFPALARAEEAERGQRAAQAIRVALVGVGLIAAVVIGAAEPLISILFGERWLPAAEIATLTAAGLLLFASVGTPLSALALANGDARSPLLGTLAQAAITFALAVILIPGSNLFAAGLAMGVGLTAFSAFLFLATAPPAVRSLRGLVLRALIIAALAAGAARLLQDGGELVQLIITLGVSGAVWLALTAVFMRGELTMLIEVVRRHVLPQRSGEPSAEAG
jgi:O-antigen/teichoic acid export membrane protein